MPGLLIEGVALLENRRLLPRMPFTGRHEPNPTVSMLVVVPAHERQDPCPGRLQRGKALSRIRGSVFTGSEEGFGEGIVIADPWPTVRGLDAQAVQRGAERNIMGSGLVYCHD